jgi:hypothetical protein
MLYITDRFRKLKGIFAEAGGYFRRRLPGNAEVTKEEQAC